MIYSICFLLLFCISYSFGQIYPQDINYSKFRDYLIDIGLGWERNTIYQPNNIEDFPSPGFLPPSEYFSNLFLLNRYFQNNSEADLFFLTLSGVEARTEIGDSAQYRNVSWTPFFWLNGVMKKCVYTQLFVRFTNQPLALPHYTGIARNIRRAGFNSGEIDRWVIGYRSDWFSGELGRSREIRGPHSEANLSLSGSSPAYERLLLKFHYKSFAYSHSFAFLEALNRKTDSSYPDTLRYLVTRTLEYSNHRNLVLGLSEIIVLSGPGRPIDLAYMNPFGFQVEVEQNDRENIKWGNWTNGMWQIDFDLLLTPNLRLAGSSLLDEIQLDRADRKISADQIGYLLHIAYTPLRQPFVGTILADYVKMGTYTTQHSNPSVNLVTRSRYMGHYIGNDADLWRVGGRVILRKPVVAELGVGEIRRGANSLLSDPYKPYKDTSHKPFPSRPMVRERFGELKGDGYLFKRLYLGIMGRFSWVQKPPNQKMRLFFRWEIAARYTFIWNKVL